MMMTKLHSLVFALLISLSIVTPSTIRCYLCSQTTLVECVGDNRLNPLIYTTVLQYYTEPCNGQCVLFRNENSSIVRGCSWTYGHMTQKANGWHDISPGVRAYFCDSYLCNSGTYEQPEIPRARLEADNSRLILSPQDGNHPKLIPTGEDVSGQLHQCYSCTARFPGCGELLDPQYASSYIRPCPSSCIIFRNPNDLDLLTRDCSIYWPQIRAKTGLHRLLDSDAFFCQESLCNGISFDFIMGIFYNQSSAIVTFPPPATHQSTSTTVDIYSDSVIWDDADLDFIPIESTTWNVSVNSTDDLLDNNTIIDNFDFIEVNSSVDEWYSNETYSSDEFMVNTSSIPLITEVHYVPSDNDTEEVSETTDETSFPFPSTIDVTTTIRSIVDDHDSDPLNPFFFFPLNNTKELLLEYMKPLLTLAMPPFSYMLNMAAQNRSETTNIPLPTTTSPPPPAVIYEYCKDKQCDHGGRLNSDCLCICLPTFTGDNCETVLCEEEPRHICSLVLEHECQTDYIRYLCPRFCQMDVCTEKKNINIGTPLYH